MSFINTGPTFPVTETSESLPRQSLLPMELPSTSSAVGSPAKTSALPPMPARAFLATALGFGETMGVSFANYDRNSSSWKTCRPCSREDSETFSEIWPRSGTMRNGIASRLPPLVRLIRGIGSGLWPTPRKCSGKNSAGTNRADFYRRMGFSPSSTTKGGRTASPTGGPLNPEWLEGHMGFPIGWTDLDA